MCRVCPIFFIYIALVSFSIAIAQDQVREVATPQSVLRDGTIPSCVALLHTWEDATAQAQTYTSVVNVVRANGNELMYQEAEHFRSSEDGDWIREVTLERSFLPFPIPNNRPEEEENEDEDASFFCEGATVEAQGSNWLVRLATIEDSPMTNSTMLYEPQGDRYIITDMSGDFDVRILAFNLKGRFMTSFGDWVFPPTNR